MGGGGVKEMKEHIALIEIHVFVFIFSFLQAHQDHYQGVFLETSALSFPRMHLHLDCVTNSWASFGATLTFQQIKISVCFF